ncbi:sugar phosphate nucleotidyltransferase [Paenibacillus sp. sgz302251]|uniref:sugar phosphate nucleotidyltransferase n=1 Tax=Paenibacillus sp. sgz302251 TaxID=3414493 RepID=UPI003C7ACEA6
MRIVLLCGGEGKRLWPLSYPNRTKPFIPLFEEADGKQSIIQRIWGQLQSSGLSHLVHFVIGTNQAALLVEQLGRSAAYIIEPASRGTYPAVVYAAAYLRSHELLHDDEALLIMPGDLYADDSFFEAMKQLEPALSKSASQLAMIGVTPDCPSDQYGYIVPERLAFGDDRSYMHVKHFCEKPDLRAAAELLEQGAYWNSGVAAFPLSFLLTRMKVKGTSLDYKSVHDRFYELEPTSFDYEILENVQHAVVLPYEGRWKDLGSWGAVKEVWTIAGSDRVNRDEACRNISLLNETEIPVRISGAENLLIVVSKEGILIKAQ